MRKVGEDRLNLEGHHLFGNVVNLNSELEVILDLTVDTRSFPSQPGFTRTVVCSFILFFFHPAAIQKNCINQQNRQHVYRPTFPGPFQSVWMLAL